MRSSSELMSLFVQLVQMEFHAAPVTMWSEAFSAWASMRSRADDDSSEQWDEYCEFLRNSIEHLKQVRDSSDGDHEVQRASHASRLVLEGIFAHVARLIAFAEAKSSNGKMPRGEESAVLDRGVLTLLLGDAGESLLDEAIQRRQNRNPNEAPL